MHINCCLEIESFGAEKQIESVAHWQSASPKWISIVICMRSLAAKATTTKPAAAVANKAETIQADLIDVNDVIIIHE